MPMIEGGFGLSSNGASNVVSLTQQSALQVFENIAVLQNDLEARLLGLYGDVSLGRDLTFRMGSFKTPRNMFTSRKNGCVWTPKGGLRFNLDEFPTCPIEWNGEQCPDVFYSNCFERLFAPGNGVRDLAGTPEGQAVLAQMLRQIYFGLGNSFFDLYNFANHPLITDANTGAFYRASVADWTAYLDQMTSGTCAGLITQLDALAAAETPGYNLDISNNDIDESTGKFTGDIIALFETLKAAASSNLKTAMQNGIRNINGTASYPIILLADAEFNAYKAYIRSMAGTNEPAYRYVITSNDGVTPMSHNILMYEQMPVIRWQAVSEFDAVVGTQSHRAAIVAPGVFGVLHDVPDIMQFEGMGLMVEQSTRLQDKGKIFMTTNLRWGAGIADKDFVVMASNILHP